MKLTTLYFLLVIINYNVTNGQEYCFDYKLEYRQTSEDNFKQIEFFSLFTNDNKTKFISHNKLKIDSIKKKAKTDKTYAMNILSNLGQVPKTNFSFTIYSNIQSDTLTVIDKIIGDNYIYKDNVKLDWLIQNDTLTINNYKCRKATMNFRGREYIAWFSTNIPISSGPYKFRGLPGLIVKVEDIKQDYIFELVNIKELRLNNSFFNYDKNEFIATDRIEFKKTQKTAAKNYYNNLKQNGIDLNEEGKRLFKNKASLKLKNPIELIDDE